MKMHESVAENRVRFATSLTEMSQELAKVANEGDQERKNVRFMDLLTYVLPILRKFT